MDLSDLRKDFCKGGLSEDMLKDSPLELFDLWFKQAQECQIPEVNAMSVATVNAEGVPSIRVVLLKAYNEDGFVFYTNYESQKAQDIEANNNICINFFWEQLERQIRIIGKASKVSKAQSLKYFLSRPSSSQLGAWVSNQSKIISSRSILEMKFEQMKRKFANGQIPLPDNWGGYILKPTSFEFWQGRPSRLHDRFKYTQNNNSWQANRLAP